MPARRCTPWLLLSLLLALGIYSLRQRASRTPFHARLPLPVSRTALLDASATHNYTWAPTRDNPTQQIPPYVHFIFGLDENFGGKPFSFIHFLCLSSALKVLKPEILFLHHVYEPSGFWWTEFQLILDQSNAKLHSVKSTTTPTTQLVKMKQRDVTTVFGNAVTHFAHKADVLRLEVLRDYGGVYLDSDVLVLRDLREFYRHETVMGMESQPNLDRLLPPSGLCNAVILSKPFGQFVGRWLNSYRSFDSSRWAGHSVTMPWILAQKYPRELTILNKFAFFWPIWHDDHLRLVHRTAFSDTPSFSFRKSSPLAPTYDKPFTYHLWESVAFDRYLSYYDPDTIWNRGRNLKGSAREEDGMNEENAFGLEMRQYVSEETRRRWRDSRR